MANDILVLRSKIKLSDFDIRQLQMNILAQRETGVILIPDYVEVVKMPDGEISGELVVMNGGEEKAERYVIRNVEGLYFKSFGRSMGSRLHWADTKDDAMKYDSKQAAENWKLYLHAVYECHNLKVEEC